MTKVHICLKVDSIRDAEDFYCRDLDLFIFYQDYGMGTISLALKTNPTFLLILSTGDKIFNDDYLFEIETKNCDLLFQSLHKKKFSTSGQLLSQDVFEYALGKSIALKDPSNNKFLIFEEYHTEGN